MKYSIDLLQKYIKEKFNAEDLADKLTGIGFETELENNILDSEITPNHPEALSVYGIAKEFASFYNLTLIDPELLDIPTDESLKIVSIDDKAKEYVLYDYLVEISNYKPTNSPKEIVDILSLLNLKPKDLLIDLTNIITLECGGPLHIFDKNFIKNGLTVELSKNNDKIELINGQTKTLPDGLLIQKSGGEIVDLAGVMGAKNSAANNCSEIILQAAGFDSALVRKAAKATSTQTEASYRYERIVAESRSVLSLKRFMYLAKKYCPQIEFKACQIIKSAAKPVVVKSNIEKISKILGNKIEINDLKKLEKIGFKVAGDEVAVPDYRIDINCDNDIAEELLRIDGYDKIENQPLEKINLETKSTEYNKELAIKERLVENGLSENYTYSFASEKTPLKIKNPLSNEFGFMRDSLKTNLLQAVGRSPFINKLAIFEIGNVFLPDEKTHLAIASNGYKNKQLAELEENLSKVLEIEIKFDNVSDLADSVGLKTSSLSYFECDLSSIKSFEPTKIIIKKTVFKPVSKFPPTLRDVTIVVEKSVTSEQIIEKIKAEELLVCELIDSFENAEKLGADKIAYTFRLIFQKLDGTISDESADEITKKCFQEDNIGLKFEIR